MIIVSVYFILPHLKFRVIRIGTLNVYVEEILTRIPNVVLLPCRTQINLARQWHEDKTNHPSSGKICQE